MKNITQYKSRSFHYSLIINLIKRNNKIIMLPIAYIISLSNTVQFLSVTYNRYDRDDSATSEIFGFLYKF